MDLVYPTNLNMLLKKSIRTRDAFTAGANFMLEESNAKIAKLTEANDELTRQNNVLRHHLMESLELDRTISAILNTQEDYK